MRKQNYIYTNNLALRYFPDKNKMHRSKKQGFHSKLSLNITQESKGMNN